MPVKPITCHQAACDQCDKVLTCEDGENGEWAPHFGTVEAALNRLHGNPDVDREDDEGWPPLLDGQQLPDGRILCGRCDSERLHAHSGHRWVAWRRCDCYDPTIDARRIERHQAAGQCPEYRYCQRRHCNAWEERPIETVPR